MIEPGRNLYSTTLRIDEPQLWSSWDHGAPNLYQYELVATSEEGRIESAVEQFGIREIAMDENLRFSLNGRPIFLRGTNVIPTQWLASYTQAMIERDIGLLRSAHINCVRVHGHVQREEFYRACDEAGIMVWCDFPLQWGYVDSPEFVQSAQRQVKDWVRLLRNRPGIIAWCCHNEPTHNRRTLSPLLAKAAKEEDTTRPVFEAR